MQDRHPARETVVPVICIYNKTYLTNYSCSSIPGSCISQLVLFKQKSAAHLKCAHSFSLGWSPVPQMLPNVLTRHFSPQLEQCWPHTEFSTRMVPARNVILQIASSANVIYCWLSGSVIIENKWWLLKCHMNQAWWVKSLMMRQLGVWHFDHLTTQDMSMFT